jgi:hypothetical protein
MYAITTAHQGEKCSGAEAVIKSLAMVMVMGMVGCMYGGICVACVAWHVACAGWEGKDGKERRRENDKIFRARLLVLSFVLAGHTPPPLNASRMWSSNRRGRRFDPNISL